MINLTALSFDMSYRSEQYDQEDIPYGFCSDCKAECRGVLRDFGIGAYEFWGDRGVHKDVHIVSPCCESEVVETIDEDEQEDD